MRAWCLVRSGILQATSSQFNHARALRIETPGAVHHTGAEWLEEMIRDLMKFFADAAARGDAVIFYVG